MTIADYLHLNKPELIDRLIALNSAYQFEDFTNTSVADLLRTFGVHVCTPCCDAGFRTELRELHRGTACEGGCILNIWQCPTCKIVEVR